MPATFDELKERAKPWMDPIPGPAPGGVAAKLEPAYQLVSNEVAKLDMPAGGVINWKNVADSAGNLLTSKTKDLLLASYLAHALHRMGGFDGLVTGVTLMAEMIDRYWDTFHPDAKRIRGRVNALQWFLDKTEFILPTNDLPAAELERIQNLDVAAKQLAQVVREKFADAAPAMRPLLERVERLRLTAEAAAPPPPPPPQPVAAESPATPSGAPTGQGASVASAPAPALSAAGDVTEFLRNVGSSLISAAGAMRQANLSDPAAYRVLRVGLWLHLTAPPGATGGKTTIAPLPEALRNQLTVISQNQKWAAVIEETESALQNNRFALDLHRMTWQALAALGPGYDRAKEAVAIEVRAILGRMTQLASLAFSDGSPFADPQTRSWLEEEIAPKGGSAPKRAGAAPSDEATEAKMAEARKLIGSNQPAEALAMLQSLVMSSPAGRQRFVMRLDFARLCTGGGLMPVAQAIYEELEKDATAHHLDEWEPELVSECLKGLISAARALAKDPRGISQDFTQQFKRLCRIDPAAAHEVWP